LEDKTGLGETAKSNNRTGGWRMKRTIPTWCKYRLPRNINPDIHAPHSVNGLDQKRRSVSLVRTTEELLGRKSSGSGLENRD
jgi:hypothetical protein